MRKSETRKKRQTREKMQTRKKHKHRRKIQTKQAKYTNIHRQAKQTRTSRDMGKMVKLVKGDVSCCVTADNEKTQTN